MDDLAGAQRVQRQLGVGPLDRGKGALVPLDAELGMVAALEHDLGRAQFDGLAASGEDVVDVADPALLVAGRPVERAEPAGGHAHVRVVDVPVDDVGDDVVREAAAAGGVGGPAERVQRRPGVQQQRLVGGDPPAVSGTREHGRDRLVGGRLVNGRRCAHGRRCSRGRRRCGRG